MMGMPNCRAVARRLSQEQDDPTIAPRSLGLRLHLVMCRNCRRYEYQLYWLREQLRRVLVRRDTARLSERERERILNHLQSEPGPPD